MQILVKTYDNLEPLLQQELRDLGVQEMTIVKRGIQFEGDHELLYKCNYLLRTGLKVLVNIDSGKVTNENALYDFVYAIPWEDYFNVKQTFAVSSTVFSSLFTHTQYVALKTKDAIVDRFRDKQHRRPSVNRVNPDIRINIHMHEASVNISLDSSGESLHKRNYKMHQVEAPLSEVLAAGLLKLAGYDGSQDLLDPMCGSGTIGMEAFMVSRNIPAGYFRENFCFENWDTFEPETWATIKANANAAIKQSGTGTITCRDKQLSSVRKVEENFEVFHEFNPREVTVARKDYFKTTIEQPYLVIMNPPYDDKLEIDDILGYYTSIGDTLKKYYTGSTAWIISGHLDAMKYIGLKTSRKIDLLNGPTPVKFQKYELYQGTKRIKSDEEE